MPGSLNSYLTIVGVAGMLLTFLATGLTGQRLTSRALFMLMLAACVHIVASDFYYEFTKTNSADAAVYYFDPWGWEYQPFSLGSIAVFNFVHILKQNFSATYLDCFLVFQAIGFTGMILMYRTFCEIQQQVDVQPIKDYSIILFLPSLNFWTAAIGKDSLLFFAASLCTWSVINLRRRFTFFCISLGVMILFRVHIALMASTALALTAFFDRSMSAAKKMGLLAIATVGILFVSGAVQGAIGLDVSSVNSVTDFLDQQNKIYATVGGSTALGNAPWPSRIVGLIFRPLFFDAGGILGLIASVENIGVICALIYILKQRRYLTKLFKQVFFVRFVTFFTMILLFSLSLVYYNVGLGLRERVMVYPMFFSILVSLWSVSRKSVATFSPPPSAPVSQQIQRAL